jgi:hypothetical protein
VCNHLARDQPISGELMAGTVQGLTGRRFGRLLIIERAADKIRSNGRIRARWRCICDCGSEYFTIGESLTGARTASCGCLRRERLGAARRTHGCSKAVEYHSWLGMVARCENPSNRKWPDYGGRGITVCERWRSDFTAFLSDIGMKPTPEHTLDRIDVNGNYEPSNCRWATPLQQSQNRRNNQYTTFRGRHMLIVDVARELNLPIHVLRNRVLRDWPESRWSEPYKPRTRRRQGIGKLGASSNAPPPALP